MRARTSGARKRVPICWVLDATIGISIVRQRSVGYPSVPDLRRRRFDALIVSPPPSHHSHGPVAGGVKLIAVVDDPLEQFQTLIIRVPLHQISLFIVRVDLLAH